MYITFLNEFHAFYRLFLKFRVDSTLWWIWCVFVNRTRQRIIAHPPKGQHYSFSYGGDLLWWDIDRKSISGEISIGNRYFIVYFQTDQALGASHQALGAKYHRPGTRCQSRQTRRKAPVWMCVILASKHQAPGARHQAPDTIHQSPGAPGTRRQSPGASYQAPGASQWIETVHSVVTSLFKTNLENIYLIMNMKQIFSSRIKYIGALGFHRTWEFFNIPSLKSYRQLVSHLGCDRVIYNT